MTRTSFTMANSNSFFYFLENPFDSTRKPVLMDKKSNRKVQGVPQSQVAALPRHQEEEKTDKTKQAQIEQTYEKHED